MALARRAGRRDAWRRRRQRQRHGRPRPGEVVFVALELTRAPLAALGSGGGALVVVQWREERNSNNNATRRRLAAGDGVPLRFVGVQVCTVHLPPSVSSPRSAEYCFARDGGACRQQRVSLNVVRESAGVAAIEFSLLFYGSLVPYQEPAAQHSNANRLRSRAEVDRIQDRNHSKCLLREGNSCSVAFVYSESDPSVPFSVNQTMNVASVTCSADSDEVYHPKACAGCALWCSTRSFTALRRRRSAHAHTEGARATMDS